MREPDSQHLTKVVLGALIFVMGVQSMRFLFASTAWYLRDTLGIGTLDLIPIALAPFLLGIVIPLLSRSTGMRGSLMLSIWILFGTRLGLQVLEDPAADFFMAAIGSFAFVSCLPLLLSIGREAIVGGVLLGLAIDSGIKGLFSSLDLGYQTGLLPVLVAAVTGGAAVFLAFTVDYMPRRGVDWRSGMLLLGLGPFLMIQYLILQNQGWLAEVTGVSSPIAAARIAVLNVVALLVVSRAHRSLVVAWLATGIVVAAVFVAEGNALAFNLLSLIAIPAAAILWASLVPETGTEKIRASAFYLTVGATGFVVLGFAYYLPLDLNIGFQASDVRVVVAGLLGLLGILATLRVPAANSGAGGPTWVFAAAAAVLPLFALIVSLVDSGLEPEAGEGFPIRVMSYNLHSGFNVDGVLDPGEIARVIEDSGATLVGLQEVPRGRLLSANTDLYHLLVEELGFHHVEFFGTTDPTWGNAIFSRYPISEVDRVYLPKAGTPMQRGYLEATVLVDGGPVLFASTHLQHINDAAAHEVDPEADLYPVHDAQISMILEEWGGRGPAVLVGDFNARPDWRQIDELLDKGWIDSWAEAGAGDGFTSSADDPAHRIDYVFHTDDLVAADAGVIQSRASDHFPVVVDIDLR